MTTRSATASASGSRLSAGLTDNPPLAAGVQAAATEPGADGVAGRRVLPVTAFRRGSRIDHTRNVPFRGFTYS